MNTPRIGLSFMSLELHEPIMNVIQPGPNSHPRVCWGVPERIVLGLKRRKRVMHVGKGYVSWEGRERRRDECSCTKGMVVGCGWSLLDGN